MSSNTQLAPTTFPQMLEKFQGEIAKALPKHLTAERMTRIALTAFRRTPKLADCDPRSVFAAVIQAAQLGLEPDTLGRSYLIPYGKECQFVPGWKGLVDLCNRSGNATVFTGVIYRDQRYTYSDGAKRDLVIHDETELEDPEDITHTFAVGWIRGAEFPVIELWRNSKIIKHRDRYNKVGKRHYSYQNWEMYARKVPLLQVLKYMPASPELVLAMGLNDAAEMGGQGLTVQDAIEGSWVPLPRDDERGQQQDEQRERTVREPQARSKTAEAANGAGEPAVDPETGEILGSKSPPAGAQQEAAGAVQREPAKTSNGAPAPSTDQDHKAKTTPVGTGQLGMIRTKLKQTDGAISEQDVLRRFKLDSLDAATVYEANQILEWLRNPN